MVKPIIISVLFVWIFQQSCICDEHHYGNPNSGDKVLVEKQLFVRNEHTAKNFTIIFKYIASEMSPNVTHARFNVMNATSTASIEVASEKGKEKNVQAILSIVNGTNFKVTATLHGSGVNLIDVGMLMKAIGDKDATPKTFTVVYAHNQTKSLNRKVVLGKRQHGDKMIAFQTKNVTLSSRFAESEFEYADKHKYITSIGFSFDSPTAIAFINSTFIKENRLNAIVYDLNSLSFVANMSVYGYDDFDKPDTYKPIVFSQSKRSAH